MPYLTRQKSRVTIAYTVSLIGVLLTLLLPWPLKFMIDNVLTGEDSLPLLQSMPLQQQVIVLAGGIVLLATLAAITLGIDKVLHAAVRERFSYTLRDDLLQRLFNLSRFRRQQEMSGELTMRLVSDAQLVSRLFCKTLPLALKHAATAIFTLVSIMLLSVPLGLTALLLAAVLSAVVLYFGPQLSRAAAEKRSREGKVAALTQETVKGIEHVQAMALERRSRDRYLLRAAQSLGAGVREVRVAVRLERSAQVIAGFALASVAGVGGIAVAAGKMSLGTLTVCLAYVTQLLKPIEKLNDIATSMSRGLVRAERIHELLRDEPAARAARPGLDPGLIERIDCVDLCYRYPGNTENTVAGLNHSFRRGECTAVTGASGCGKSTLLRIILQLQTPTCGQITVNGHDYRSVDNEFLRTQFAVLLQDAHLFAGTVREILTELKPGVAVHQLRQALADVDLLDLVDAMPDGIDTPIDESGGRISGGQRARLLLARALVSERPVLALDEPFANIDAESRHIILQSLMRAKQDRIVIVVSHESGSRSIADSVLTLAGMQVAAPDPCNTVVTPIRFRNIAREGCKT